MRPAFLALVLAGLATPAGAAAATRYVSPTGVAEGPCERTAPCSVAWALSGGSVAGDTVVVGAGSYAGQPLVLDRPLTITAAPDRARPVFRTTASDGIGLTITAGAAGSLVEHLAIRAEGAGARAAVVEAAATVRDVVLVSAAAPCLQSTADGVRVEAAALTLTGEASAPCLQTTGDDTLWSDVTVAAFAGEIAAAHAGNGAIAEGTFSARGVGLELRGTPRVHRVTATGGRRGIVLSGAARVTDSVAVASGPDGAAIFAGDGAHQLLNVTAWAPGQGATGIRASTGGELSVKNTIARGRSADLQADPAAEGPAGVIAADHSNFRTGPGILDFGANQSGALRLTAPASGNFRPRRGSPAIDAGSFESNSGSADRDGRFRWLGVSPDIGAYEFPSPRPRRPKRDVKAPTFGVLRLTAPAFRVAVRGQAFTAARAAVGTRLVYVVSEDSDLVLQVRRPGNPRSLGTIVRPSARGTSRLLLSGRVGGRPLAPGRYVLTVIARDVAQNLSYPRRLPFTVIR